LQSSKNETRAQHVQLRLTLVQEDDPATLNLVAAFLLFDGKQNEATLETLNEEGSFPRILELIRSMQEDGSLQRILLQLMYEMSRIQRIKDSDLSAYYSPHFHPKHPHVRCSGTIADYANPK
jgi:hypothetical protein